jgi:transposase
MKRPEDVKLSREEGHALIERVKTNTLNEEDRRVVVKLIELWFWLNFALTEAKLSMKRLKRLLFGGGRDSGDDDGAPPPEPAQSESPPPAEDPVVSDDAPSEDDKSKKPRRGHGRKGAQAYTGAKTVACRHETLSAGERCPACGRGKLYGLPPGVELRVDGHALLSAMRYEVEKLRCSACGAVFTADLPPEVGAQKYTAEARAVVVLSRYYLGLPFYRLEGFQASVGVPVSDATLWDLADQMGDRISPVFKQLAYEAAQSERFFHDDTHVRIVSLLKENRQAAEAAATGVGEVLERTGIQTSGIVAQHGDRTIILYYSGRSHAGENLSEVLEKRQTGLPKPIVMSDALSSNTLKNEAEVIRCYCLFHGRRQFDDLEHVFPQSTRVLEDLKQVFQFEAHTRKQGMNAEQRLAYHQQHSRPLLDELKPWMEAQVADREVEPNSSLGKAFSYLLKRWPSLTRFLTTPNAPLDSNTVERALKLMIRQRRNSLFFATEHGGTIASVLTSVIATCVAAGVNVLSYLVALQHHHEAVCRAPSEWLPWNFTDQLPG